MARGRQSPSDRGPAPSPAAGAPGGDRADESTRLARQRTSLAVERSFLAAERTLMAWLRTSLSMIGFGFTLVKFFEYLEEQQGGPIVGHFGRTWSSTTFGMAMMLIGTGALIFAIIQHRRRTAALRREGLLPQWELALNVAVLVAILGVLAMGSIVAGL